MRRQTIIHSEKYPEAKHFPVSALECSSYVVRHGQLSLLCFICYVVYCVNK